MGISDRRQVRLTDDDVGSGLLYLVQLSGHIGSPNKGAHPDCGTMGCLDMKRPSTDRQ